MLKTTLFAAAALAVLPSLAHAEPGGSYRRSCDNIRQRGPILSADCETVDGDVRRSSIDLRGCGGGVANTNGRLTCGGGGYRGGGYDGRPRYGVGGFGGRGYGGPDYDNDY